MRVKLLRRQGTICDRNYLKAESIELTTAQMCSGRSLTSAIKDRAKSSRSSTRDCPLSMWRQKFSSNSRNDPISTAASITSTVLVWTALIRAL